MIEVNILKEINGGVNTRDREDRHLRAAKIKKIVDNKSSGIEVNLFGLANNMGDVKI